MVYTRAIVGLLALCAVAQCQRFDALNKYIIDKAAGTSIPVSATSKSLNVSIGMTLIQLTSLDSKSGDAELEAWMTFQWTDTRLSWDSATFNDVTITRIPVSKIWNHDVILFNGKTSASETLAVVHSDGSILHMPPTTIKTRCDVNNYTTDGTVTCSLKYGSWTYDGFLLNLVSRSTSVDVSSYESGGIAWHLTDHAATREVNHYPCCSEPYVDVTFTLTFQVKGQRYSGWSIFS
ncbi:neuronal acetylcholine receptor subunit alpha-10-like [Haliotis rufescens]|uniref:neuronal acetylcholine receptor subunit alpha-10-like n=1 Tax=Haliotis rufescens TaxID=6454 RepID=UPI001EB00B9F|nr:neuronal acetylcholine receptor subunit alpha-10-like [Haliotis rufescens]